MPGGNIIIMKAAISFTQGNVVSVLLVLVVAIVILGFGTGTIAGLNEIKEMICKYDPTLAFCGQYTTTTQEFERAKTSVTALSCGINSIAAGDQYISCTDDFRGSYVSENTNEGLLGFFTGFAAAIVEDGYEIRQEEINCRLCGSEERCDDRCFKELCDDGDIYGCEVTLAELKRTGLTANKCLCRVKIPDRSGLYFSNSGYSWDCVVTTNDESSGNATLGRVFGSTEDEGMAECGEIIKDSGIEYKEYYLTEKKDELEATVNNFRLPQKLESESGSSIKVIAEESIAQMGDPKYVVYYEIFPEGEDFWNGASDWYTDAGQAIFIGLCLSHVLKPLGVMLNSAKKVVIRPISTVKSISGKTNSAIDWLGNKMGSAFRLDKGIVADSRTRKGLAKLLARANYNHEVVNVYVSKYGEGYAVKHYLDDVVKAGVPEKSATYNQLQTVFNNMNSPTPILAEDTQLLAKYLPKETSESVFRRLLLSVDAREASFKFAAMNALDIASYYVLRFNSEFGKFMEPYSTSLVLQNSMNEEDLRTSGEKDAALYIREMNIHKPNNVLFPEVQNVVDLKKPVVLSREEWLTKDRIKPLVLASPCRANLRIFNTKEPVRCSFYSYEKETGITTCRSPDEEGFIAKTFDESPGCGTLQYNMRDDAKEAYKVEGKTLPEIEYDFLANQMENTVVFRGRTTITTDSVCCRQIYESYAWLQRDTCSTENWEIVNPASPEYSSCDPEEKPDSRVETLEIYDPINKISLYYVIGEQRVKYYRVKGSSGILDVPPERFATKDKKLVVNSNNGICYDVAISSPYSPTLEYSLDNEDVLTCLVSGFETPDISSGMEWSTAMDWSYTIYGNKDDSGEVDMRALEIVYEDGFGSLTFGYTGIVLSDEDLDGKIDTLGHNLWDMDSGLLEIFGTTIHGEFKKISESSFISNDNGDIVAYMFSGVSADEGGTLSSTTCSIDAIAVEPNLVDVEGEYNYCYQKDYGTTVGAVTTAASFALSAITKAVKTSKLGGWVSWSLAMAVDCGLAVAHYKWNYKWPGNK